MPAYLQTDQAYNHAQYHSPDYIQSRPAFNGCKVRSGHFRGKYHSNHSTDILYQLYLKVIIKLNPANRNQIDILLSWTWENEFD